MAVPGSPALAAKLAAEEHALAQRRGQLQVMPQIGPKVLPHPAAIASWVDKLAELIEAKPLKAAMVLRRVLTPFRVTHRNGGTNLVGALDVGASVCDSSSGGDVPPDCSETGWIPIEATVGWSPA